VELLESRDNMLIMQMLVHHPGAVSIALLSLVALILVLNRLGLMAWVPWLHRRKDTQPDKAEDDYWRTHQ
jgi:hypothetical protein